MEVPSELKSLLKRGDAPVILKHVGHMPLLEAEQAVAALPVFFLPNTKVEQSIG